ncbi:MAG: hypothetical protein JF616_18690 [Fibrobacteres bacterium]|nr:hypothetical protein [Fibrobacterota bacterium]
MDRRRFLRTGGAALAALALPRRLRADACPAPTTDDYNGYGPYYLDGAPRQSRLGLPDEPGVPLQIQGTVSNCAGPLSDISLEVWHATDAGCYIHPSQPECDDHGNPEASRLWGRMITGADGAFEFRTIKPGAYLNGDAYRPSHIHFRVRQPASDRYGAYELVTQLYFEGDPYIAGDAGAEDPGAKTRIIPLTAIDGVMSGNFPVFLPGGSTALGHRNLLADPALRAFDVYVERSGDFFRILLPPVPAGQQIETRIHDAAGILVRRSLHTSPIELDASLLPRGVYQAEFQWWTDKGRRTESVALRR